MQPQHVMDVLKRVIEPMSHHLLHNPYTPLRNTIHALGFLGKPKTQGRQSFLPRPPGMVPRSPTKKPPSNASAKGIPSKRAPTPLRSTPIASATTSILTSSTATGSKATPHEAMVASQQTHINELVNKTRSLENSIKRLTDELEKSNSECTTLCTERASWEVDRKTWTGDRQKWMEEKKIWAEGCDTMQACHRIQQYRMACVLNDERIAILRMQDDLRKEQLKRLQRDYKITMFLAREVELEAQVEELASLRDAAEADSGRFEKLSNDLKTRCTALADEVKAKTVEIQSIHKLREQSDVCYPLHIFTSSVHDVPHRLMI